MHVKYATTLCNCWTRYPSQSSNGWVEFWPEAMKFLVDMLNHAHWLRIRFIGLRLEGSSMHIGYNRVIPVFPACTNLRGYFHHHDNVNTSTFLFKIQRFSRAGPRGRAREWATQGVHPLSWLLSNNRLEEVCGTLTKGTFSSRLLLSNQNKGCTPSVAHSLPLPLPPDFCLAWT